MKLGTNKLTEIYKFNISEHNSINPDKIKLRKLNIITGGNCVGKTDFLRRISDNNVFSFIKNNLKKSKKRKLNFDGSNVASILYYLKSNFHESYYDRVIDIVKLAFPNFSRLSFPIYGNNLSDFQLGIHFNNSIIPIDCCRVSDAMIRFICLTTLLNCPDFIVPYDVLLIDDVDLGFDNICEGLVADMLKNASLSKTVITTAKSETFLRLFDTSDLIFVNLNKNYSHLYRVDEV